jgi:hypothetical protein
MNALLLESSGKLLSRSILAANIHDRVTHQQFAPGRNPFGDIIDQATALYSWCKGTAPRAYVICQSVREKSLP